MTVAELADLYIAKDWAALSEQTEIRDGYAGVRAYWREGVWEKIMDELDRREITARNLRWDLRARAEGWRNVNQLVAAVNAAVEDGDIPPDLVACYLRVTE